MTKITAPWVDDFQRVMADRNRYAQLSLSPLQQAVACKAHGYDALKELYFDMCDQVPSDMLRHFIQRQARQMNAAMTELDLPAEVRIATNWPRLEIEIMARMDLDA